MPGRTGATYFGSSLSAGRYKWMDHWFKPEQSEVNELAVFLNGELGYEVRTTGGFTWRSYAGAGLMMNPGDMTCDAYDGCMSPSSRGPVLFAGMAFGYAF